MRGSLLWLAMVGFVLGGCGEDGSSTKPPPEDGVNYPVGRDSVSVQHEEVVISAPTGLFQDGSTINALTLDQPTSNAPPANVTVLSDVLSLRVAGSALDVGDPVDLESNSLRVAFPYSSELKTYVRSVLSLPGREPLLLFAPTQVNDARTEVCCYVPLGSVVHLAEGDGAITVELQVASLSSGENAKAIATPTPMNLYAIEWASEGVHVIPEPLTGTLENQSGKTPLIFVHGWDPERSEQQEYPAQADKILAYWETALEYFLTRADDEFEIFGLFYDEDERLVVSSWFLETEGGRTLVRL